MTNFGVICVKRMNNTMFALFLHFNTKFWLHLRFQRKKTQDPNGKVKKSHGG